MYTSELSRPNHHGVTGYRGSYELAFTDHPTYAQGSQSRQKWACTSIVETFDVPIQVCYSQTIKDVVG